MNTKQIKSYVKIFFNFSFIFGIFMIFFLYMLDAELPFSLSEQEREFTDIRNKMISITYAGMYSSFFIALSTISFGVQYCNEWNAGIVPQLVRKWGIKKYSIFYTILSSLSGGLISSMGLFLFIAYMRKQLFVMNQYCFDNYANIGMYDYTVGKNNSIGYVLILLALMFLSGSLAAVISLCISTLTKNRYIIMIAPYIIYKFYIEFCKAVNMPNKFRIDFYLRGRQSIGFSYITTFSIIIIFIILTILIGQFVFRKGIRRNLIYEKY